VPETFHCTLVTPQAAMLDAELTYANLPAHDGQLGIAPSRAPLLAKLGVGKLSLQGREGDQAFVLDGGFAQMRDNRLALLCERAWSRGDVSAEQAQRQLREAEAMPKSTVEEVEKRNYALALARSMVELAS